ncbi:hypothetical protein [Maribellus sp. YY47]|uniref:hypothetical protein n=1 Tax=Maribellus sp. YY47 TaxID=2929486 RepID=UPI002000BAE3|nr:hypothetical protein [Maribellus sp. YY47]MCK3684878.1 hypothetical protein [Maribellus sp. YY47]
MKNLRFLAVFIFLFAFVAGAGNARGNKSSAVVPWEWNPAVVPIDCIGDYSGLVVMNMTFFATGKVLNKASGTITDSEGHEYTIESLFNCHLFVRDISVSGNSNQTMTFRVRSSDTGKIVATVHFTWHYEDWNGEGNASMINARAACH